MSNLMRSVNFGSSGSIMRFKLIITITLVKAELFVAFQESLGIKLIIRDFFDSPVLFLRINSFSMK